jgi:hypothetical protein
LSRNILIEEDSIVFCRDLSAGNRRISAAEQIERSFNLPVVAAAAVNDECEKSKSNYNYCDADLCTSLEG